MICALVFLCAALAAIFLYCEKIEKFVAAVIWKGLASLCFVLIGVLYSPGTDAAKWIVCGLAIGFIADILLNLRKVFTEKGQIIFLVGILVFLFGHIVYLTAVLRLSSSWPACFIIGLILTAVLMRWIFQRVTAKPVFKIFGVVYIGAIMLLNCVAIGNLITSPSSFAGVFAAGTVLFLISDILLILNTFGDEFKISLRLANIGMYYTGQVLIALSLRLLARSLI